MINCLTSFSISRPVRRAAAVSASSKAECRVSGRRRPSIDPRSRQVTTEAATHDADDYSSTTPRPHRAPRRRAAKRASRRRHLTEESFYPGRTEWTEEEKQACVVGIDVERVGDATMRIDERACHAWFLMHDIRVNGGPLA